MHHPLLAAAALDSSYNCSFQVVCSWNLVMQGFISHKFQGLEPRRKILVLRFSDGVMGGTRASYRGSVSIVFVGIFPLSISHCLLFQFPDVTFQRSDLNQVLSSIRGTHTKTHSKVDTITNTEKQKFTKNLSCYKKSREQKKMTEMKNKRGITLLQMKNTLLKTKICVRNNHIPL